MRTRSFQKYLEKRLTKEEIAEIKEEARQELSEHCGCPLCPPDHTYNAETSLRLSGASASAGYAGQAIKAIEDSEKGIGIRHAKDAEDLFKQLGIKVKKNRNLE
jgi:hypothetical protein